MPMKPRPAEDHKTFVEKTFVERCMTEEKAAFPDPYSHNSEPKSAHPILRRVGAAPDPPGRRHHLRPASAPNHHRRAGGPAQCVPPACAARSLPQLCDIPSASGHPARERGVCRRGGGMTMPGRAPSNALVAAAALPRRQVPGGGSILPTDARGPPMVPKISARRNWGERRNWDER
jgi:hypothetical protein